MPNLSHSLHALLLLIVAALMLALAVILSVFIQGQNNPATATLLQFAKDSPAATPEIRASAEQDSPAAIFEIGASAEQNKQALLEGIRQGRPLYDKMLRYQKDPVLPSHPQDTIHEGWSVADEQGQGVAMVATVRDPEGNLLAYTEVDDDGIMIYTDLAAGFVSPIPSPFFSDMERSFSLLWDFFLAFQEDSEWEFKGQGTLSGRTSLIFERGRDVGDLSRIEVVENAPLLRSDSRYEDGVLVFQETVVEYGFLPLGSVLPDPAAEAWASGRLPIPDFPG